MTKTQLEELAEAEEYARWEAEDKALCKNIGGWPQSVPSLGFPSYKTHEGLLGRVVTAVALFAMIALVSVVPLILILLGITF